MKPIHDCDCDDTCWRLGGIDKFHGMRHWLGFIPHPAQEKILKGMKKNTTIAAGRRFGKSKFAAADILYFALTHKRTIQYVISHSDDQARIIFDEIKAMALESRMVSPLIERMREFPFAEITLRNGSEIQARSTGNNNGKYIRGHKAHRIWIDEAAYVKEDVINTAISPMLADYADLDYGGWLLEISTPLGRNHFYQSFQQGGRGDEGCASFHFTSFDNPHISHKFIERERLKITDMQFRTEYLAEFVDDQICVFRWDSINDAMSSLEESYVPTKERNYYVGVDIAKMHDYTAITVIDGTDQKHCEVVYTERFNNKPYSFVVERILSVANQFRAMGVLIDETGVGAGITAHVVSELPTAEGFIFSNQSKISLINTLKTGLEQRRIKISDQNTNLINELRYYEYNFNEDTGNIKMGASHGKFDDCVISLALAYMKCAVIYSDVEVVAIDAKTKPLNMGGNSYPPILDSSKDNSDITTI